MAGQYPRGLQGKQYDVIGNYVGGIDRNTSDMTIRSNTFRELKNFFPREEGTLSKRNGIYDSRLPYFLNRIITGDYDKNSVKVEKYWYDYYKVHNDYPEQPPEEKAKWDEYAKLDHFDRFNRAVFKGETIKSVVKEQGEFSEQQLEMDCMEVLFADVVRNENFLDSIDSELVPLLDGGDYPLSHVPRVFEFIIALRSDVNVIDISSSSNSKVTPNGLSIFHLYIEVSQGQYEFIDGQLYKYKTNITMRLDDQTPFDYARLIEDRYEIFWKYDLHKEDEYGVETSRYETLNFEKFKGYYYVATGTNYIIKMQERFDMSFIEEDTTIDTIGAKNGGSWNVYKPVPIEVKNIGFNLLATEPLSYIDNIGSVNTIKGMFATSNMNHIEEPIFKIPYNKPFNLHIMFSGSIRPNKVYYRPDNGITDLAENPYRELTGTFDNSNEGVTIFRCTGINDEDTIQIKVDLGNKETEFISIFKMGDTDFKEESSVSNLKDLVFGSTHCKVINNQLVLFGNHGYIFFSDYDNFGYFPNYYYIYIANSAGEEVTAIKYFRQYNALFTNKRIYKMSGNVGDGSLSIKPLSDAIGCTVANSIKQVNTNLLFIGPDGLYILKQGYLGEGTENIEKIDYQLNEELNEKNVLQCFMVNNYYVIVKNTNGELYIYDTVNNSFYEYNLSSINEKEAKLGLEYLKHYNFLGMFASSIYDKEGPFLIVPEYDDLSFTEVDSVTGKPYRGNMNLRILRFSNLDFLNVKNATSDSDAFISNLETPYMYMGFPTNTKKFKSLFIKYNNASGKVIPLYIKVLVDDVVVLNPENYAIRYDEATETYYYEYVTTPNKDLFTKDLGSDNVIGSLELGEDVMGGKSMYQLKLNINAKGRGIKIIVSDGFDEKVNEVTKKNRNKYNFTIDSMGIIYKLKKVKEG